MTFLKNRKKIKTKKREKAKIKEGNIKKSKANTVKLNYGENFKIETFAGKSYTVSNLDIKKELTMDLFKKSIDKFLHLHEIKEKFKDQKDDKIRGMLEGTQLMENIVENAPVEFIEKLGSWGIKNIIELKNNSLLESYQLMYTILVGFSQYKIDLKKK